MILRQRASGGVALVALLWVLVATLSVEAQQPSKVYTIGFLPFATCPAPTDPPGPFTQAIAALGYIRGKNIVIECRGSADRPEQRRAFAEELVKLKADVIVAQSTPSALAAQRATTATPIVMLNVADPVGSGLVASLARPGGNITGPSILGPDQILKGLELLKEVAKRASRVAILLDLSNQAQAAQAVQQDAAADALGLKLQRVDVRSPSDLDAAFAAITRERAQALYVYPLQVGRADIERIMDFAVKHRLPTLTGAGNQFVQAGVLLHYSHSNAEHSQRAATYVDKILKGAKPADLPIEQPTKFELIINIKTAKALGLTIAPLLLLRADQVIE